VNITNITFSCVLGEVCVNFSTGFVPPNVSVMVPGEIANISVGTYVPIDYPAAIYSGLLEASADGGISATVDVFVKIPTNLTWSMTPELKKTVIQGTNGTLGVIVVENLGNVYVVLDVYMGSAGDPEYFELEYDQQQIEIPIGESKFLHVNYTAPVVHQFQSYIAEAKTRNVTAEAGEKTETTDLNISVHPYFVDILEPTEADPVINVSENDTIQVRVNLTYANYVINSNDTVVWNVALSNGTDEFWVNATSVFIPKTVTPSKLIHNATPPDPGFNYTEPIAGSDEVVYFNITLENQNGSAIYFNLTVNGVQVASNQTAPDGINVTIDAKEQGASFTVPGNQSINLTVMNESGAISNAAYLAYLQYRTNYTTGNESNESYWLLNFTAPDLPLARGYDLNVSANYTINGTNTSLFHWDVEYKSIIYVDLVPPDVVIYVTSKIPVNSTANILIYVTDAGGVKNVTATVSHHNITENLDVSFVERVGDTYTYQGQFTNTSETGEYIINATAYDMSGNSNSTSASFRVSVLVLFHGIAVDEEEIDPKPPLAVNFSLYYIEALTYQNFSTDLTGYYNETIDAGIYDIYMWVWNETLDIRGSSILTDVYNPVIFGTIPVMLIGLDSNRRGPLRGMRIDKSDNITFANVTVTFDYSSYEGKIRNPRVLGIYHCDIWGEREGCNTSWVRMSDVTINRDKHLISVLTDNLQGGYAVAEYVCGNGECEEDYGESVGNCPQDCRAPPPVTPTPPGKAGKAGVGAAAAAAPPRVPVEITSQLIFVTLRPGEHEIHSIDITNNLAQTITTDVSVTGNVWELVMIERPIFDIRGASMGTVKVKVFALPTTMEGIYTGDILTKIRERNITHVTPITVKVERPKEPLLDVTVNALTKTVEPGTNLTLEVTLLNMGETAEIDDVIVTYDIKNLETEHVIIRQQETLGIENVKTFKRSIGIPEDTIIGRYVVEINATYWDGRKQAFAIDSFDVIYVPPPVKLLQSIFSSWITYAILFAVIPGYYFGQKFYRMYKRKKKAKARYIFPMDVGKLPKPGDRSLLVGKIAETDMKAYITLDDLTTHSISAGSTGAGKSVSAMVCSEELLKRNIPIVVFDPTAQWTGFMRPCRDPAMIDLYPQFGLKPDDARAFKTNIIVVESIEQTIPWKEMMEKKGEISVFVMDKLPTKDLDKFVRKSINSLFEMRLPEARQIKMLIVYDEVHRLLPKYGGKGGYIVLERACREFRKWGLGVFMISQVLMDFKGAIRANISTEIQLRTKYEGDINRVKTKYGPDYAGKVTKLITGTGLTQNANYNNGKPWFVSFRPLLHDTKRLSAEELDKFVKVNKSIDEMQRQIADMKKRGVDTSDVEVELNLARDKLKQGLFTMSESYVESVKNRLKTM